MASPSRGADPGKNVAQRILSGEPPRLGDKSLLVRQARELYAEPRAVWRALYNLPINDPRALEATEEEVLQDLLIRHYQRQEAEIANDPTGAKRADMQDPDALARMAKRQREWALSPEVQAQFRRFLAHDRGEKPVDAKPTATPPPAPSRPPRRKVRP